MEEATASVNQRVSGTLSILQREREKNGAREKQDERATATDEPAPTAGEVKDNIQDLIKSVELANSYLRERNSPYRFGISCEGDSVIMEIEFTDSPNYGGKTVKKNITHEDFFGFIAHITGGEGLLYDTLF